MKTGSRDVFSGGKVVGKGEFPIYDTLAEATESEGEQKVLDLFNSQNATNICNTIRTAATTLPSRSKLKEEITMEIFNGQYKDMDGFNSVRGDQARLVAYLDKEIDKRLEDRKAKINVPQEPEPKEEAVEA